MKKASPRVSSGPRVAPPRALPVHYAPSAAGVAGSSSAVAHEARAEEPLGAEESRKRGRGCRVTCIAEVIQLRMWVGTRRFARHLRAPDERLWTPSAAAAEDWKTQARSRCHQMSDSVLSIKLLEVSSIWRLRLIHWRPSQFCRTVRSLLLQGHCWNHHFSLSLHIYIYIYIYIYRYIYIYILN